MICGEVSETQKLFLHQRYCSEKEPQKQNNMSNTLKQQPQKRNSSWRHEDKLSKTLTEKWKEKPTRLMQQSNMTFYYELDLLSLPVSLSPQSCPALSYLNTLFKHQKMDFLKLSDHINSSTFIPKFLHQTAKTHQNLHISGNIYLRTHAEFRLF